MTNEENNLPEKLDNAIFDKVYQRVKEHEKKNRTFAGFAYPKFLADLPRETLANRLADYKVHGYSPLSGYRQSSPAVNTDGRMFYFNSDFMPKLKWMYADDVISLKHKGWFCDNDQNDVLRGLVFQLPKQRGFLAAWTMGQQMISEVEYYIYADQGDAARGADNLARVAAENMQEEEEDNDNE